MQPRRLLQASCLLLLSAAVLARVDPNAEVKAVIAAAKTTASMPAELKPAAFNCFKNGPNGCKAGAKCDEKIDGGNCLLCQNTNGWTCDVCKAGFYPEEDATVCEECEQGYYCGGTNIRECPAGSTTEETGRWAAVQCSTCWPGYGPGPGPDGTCPACAAGTAKKLIGTEGCTNCLYGFIANANAGATDCLDAHGDPEETCAHTPLPVYIEAVNSCGCEAGSYLVLPFTNGKDDCATCEECPGNTIAPEDGALECEECPEGTVANYDKTECVEGSYGGYSPKDDDHEEEEHEEEEEEEEKEKYEKKEKYGKKAKKDKKSHKKKYDDEEEKEEKEYEKEEKPEEEEEYEKKEDTEPKEEEEEEEEEEYEYKSKYGKKAKKSHKSKYGKKEKKSKYEKEEKEEEYEKEEKPEEEEYEKKEKEEKYEKYEKEYKPATPFPKPYEYKYTPETEEEYKPATPPSYGGEYKPKEYQPKEYAPAPYGSEYKPKEYQPTPAPYNGEYKAPYGGGYKAPYGEPKAPYGGEYKYGY